MMWLVVFMALAVIARADEPKPNTLTPKEIADGWILLFDGETTFGWQIDGDAKVEQGQLIVGGAKAVPRPQQSHRRHPCPGAVRTR
jgi:hypothetical protein